MILPKSSNEEPKATCFFIGSTTFGKGSVQEVIPVSNDCAIKLTTALYYFPHDISIQGIGIKPDFDIEQRFAPTPDMEWFTNFFGYEHNLKNSIKHEKNQAPKKKMMKKIKKKKHGKKKNKNKLALIILF